MSHFSRIKTNIANAEVLTRTLKDLGFNYKLNAVSNIILNNKNSKAKNNLIDIAVYSNLSDNDSLFHFSWDGIQYNLIADIQLYNFKNDNNIEYFLDKLTQKYAYNIILNKSIACGFEKSVQIVKDDGSIKLIMQKWDIK
uniref:Uncharacterized protein ycf35 n=1 Tax=Haraldiophyllum bonnemaisonii TaxID=167977 RepID=A0A4D6WTJ9_9FLOR|nr:hypothetical protein [Haraldiophyllum bonnemaisonii]